MTKQEFIDKYTDDIPSDSCDYITTRTEMLADLEKVVNESKSNQNNLSSAICSECRIVFRYCVPDKSGLCD